MKIHNVIIVCVIIFTLTAALFSCRSGGGTETEEATVATLPETTALITDVTDNVTTSAPAALPENTVADALNVEGKTLTVTDTSVILTLNYGIVQNTVISRTDMSYKVNDLGNLNIYVMTFFDKTGQTFSINLSKEDYNKVISLINSR